ncbi:MAG: tyrosine-protein phosphatase [Alphaproteobacteria bacterium]|uniref:tyrosine-protein phosphatase n=1 Tax=Streptomyces sp. AcH 505 TaxID=352211 RepID=UPI00099D1205|nr:tyrosine-protein phosphatase [Afipia sp.]MBN9499543.1 tyrosine-protein phosphatase [Alphaproteobacteria bacterium]
MIEGKSHKWARQTNIGTSCLACIAASNQFLKFHPVGRGLTYTTNALLVCAGLAGGWAIGLQLVGNVHVVEPGVLYRSAQLNGQKLADVMDAYGIKSVINLRGANSGSWWYDNEVAVTTAHGASHADVRMSALQDPADATIAKLMETMRTAPRPILIHCQSGSDRTGLAAALFERFVERRPADIAAHQISFRYGHFPWLGSRSIAMDRTYGRLSAGGLPKPE